MILTLHSETLHRQQKLLTVSDLCRQISAINASSCRCTRSAASSDIITYVFTTYEAIIYGMALNSLLYSAFIVVPHTQGAQAWITVSPANYTMPSCLYFVSVHQMAFPPDWGCGHLIAANYSFIYPERMKG